METGSKRLQQLVLCLQIHDNFTRAEDERIQPEHAVSSPPNPVLWRAVDGLARRRNSWQELERSTGGWLSENNQNALRTHTQLPKNKLC